MQEKQLMMDDQKIFYRSTGKGKTVILIHGFAEDSDIWKNQVEFLKEKFLIIIPDLPGSGQSTMDDGPWTMDRFAEVIKAILDKENISICTVIGHSMGGYIAFAFAEKYPEQFTGLGLFHSSAYADNEEKKAARRKGIEFIKENGGFEFLKTVIPSLFGPTAKSEMPEPIEELVAKGKNFSSSALISYYEAMINRPNRTAILKRVKTPVLFIIGKYDNAVPMKDGLEQCHLPSLSYAHILENSGHMGMLEAPDLCNSYLEEFLSGCP